MLIKYAKSIPRDGGFPQQTRIICFFFVPSCPLSGLATQRSGSPDRTLYKKNAMYHFVTSIRTCYADVDQMGFVYYGNYPKFYEIARTETIRSLGISYKEMEERGIMMPVVEINLHYKRPAHYDEVLSIHTFVKEIPRGPKITFYHEIYNENGDLLNEGFVSLAFIRSDDHKPCRIPDFLKELLMPHFPDCAKTAQNHM